MHRIAANRAPVHKRQRPLPCTQMATAIGWSLNAQGDSDAHFPSGRAAGAGAVDPVVRWLRSQPGAEHIAKYGTRCCRPDRETVAKIRRESCRDRVSQYV